MAKIIGAIATSHTPTIGFALDHNKQNDPVWAPIFEAYKPIREWLDEKKPDVLFFIYNDHVTSFFFDHYSAFTLGIGNEYPVADEGGGARDLPAVGGHAGLSRHIGHSLMADEFDMSFFQQKALDHGCFSPLSLLCDSSSGSWPVQIVPLQVGVLQFPVPSARRCLNLGRALRKAIESYEEDLKVVIVATGGLSHQVHGERCGFNNPEWDARFLDLFENDPDRLADITQAEYAELGGLEGAEVIMWLIMRGAMSANMRKLSQSYYLPSMTGIATALYENQASEQWIGGERQRHLDKVATQLKGAEKLEGTYPFELQASVRVYRLNKYLHDMVIPAHRELFLSDPETSFAQADLTEEEKQLVRDRNWRGLIHYGVIFFMLEKLGAVVGVSNLHIYAAMKGMSLEDFMKTRNANALYSVAGKDTGKTNWDKPATGAR